MFYQFFVSKHLTLIAEYWLRDVTIWAIWYGYQHEEYPTSGSGDKSTNWRLEIYLFENEFLSSFLYVILQFLNEFLIYENGEQLYKSPKRISSNTKDNNRSKSQKFSLKSRIDQIDIYDWFAAKKSSWWVFWTFFSFIKVEKVKLK